MTKFFTLILCAVVSTSYGQIAPNCSSSGMNSIYVLTTDNSIYRIDNVNTIPSSPVFVDLIPGSDVGGLSISNNLNGGSPSPTFYTTIQDTFSYRSPTSWIKTNHSASTSAGNLGGGVNHIYNHRGTSGSVFSYDGSGNATYVVLFTSPTSVYDIATDGMDNFHVLVTDANLMFKFDSLGTPIDTLQVTGMPQNLIQPGLTLLNNTFYTVLQTPTQNALMRGTVNGNMISFSQVGVLNVGSQIQDIAACPFFLGSVGLDEFPDELKPSISPNPFMNQFTVNDYGIDQEQIIIYDFLGNQVLQQTLTNNPIINMEEFANGIYFYELRNHQGTINNGKVLKQ